MSTELLNTVFSDDVIGAGVIMGEHQSYLERKGLLFPPDPTSRNECTIGAAIACNASGARSFRYGPTRNWIDAVEVVLPNGEVIIADRSTAIPKSWPLPQWQEPDVKTAAGYYPATNLLDLMIGQEGTFGGGDQGVVALAACSKGGHRADLFFQQQRNVHSICRVCQSWC